MGYTWDSGAKGAKILEDEQKDLNFELEVPGVWKVFVIPAICLVDPVPLLHVLPDLPPRHLSTL